MPSPQSRKSGFALSLCFDAWRTRHSRVLHASAGYWNGQRHAGTAVTQAISAAYARVRTDLGTSTALL